MTPSLKQTLAATTGGLVIFKSIIAFFQHLFVCLKNM